MNENSSDIYDLIFRDTFRRLFTEMPRDTGTWLAVRERIVRQAERAIKRRPTDLTDRMRRKRQLRPSEVDA